MLCFNAPLDYRNTEFEPGNQQHNYSWTQLVQQTFIPKQSHLRSESFAVCFIAQLFAEHVMVCHSSIHTTC